MTYPTLDASLGETKAKPHDDRKQCHERDTAKGRQWPRDRADKAAPYVSDIPGVRLLTPPIKPRGYML